MDAFDLLESTTAIQPGQAPGSTARASDGQGSDVQSSHAQGSDVQSSDAQSSDAQGGVDEFAAVRELYRSAPPMDGPRVATGLKPGTRAPEFALPSVDGTLVRLSELRGAPVALVFYPLDWSPGCSVQLELYQQEYEEFASRGIRLLGISVDSIYSHGAWAAVRGIHYPLLSDFQPRGEAARAYKVWRDADGHSERAVYLIDADGVIRWTHVSERLKELPDFDELVSALDLVALGENRGEDNRGADHEVGMHHEEVQR